jgi:hypothetical protein
VATTPVATQSTLPTISDPLAKGSQALKSDIVYSCHYRNSQAEEILSFYFLMGLSFMMSFVFIQLVRVKIT